MKTKKYKYNKYLQTKTTADSKKTRVYIIYAKSILKNDSRITNKLNSPHQDQRILKSTKSRRVKIKMRPLESRKHQTSPNQSLN